MKIIKRTDNEVRVLSEKIGTVTLHKFSENFDHGLYRQRPWHIVTFGRNFATVRECLLFLKGIEDSWEDETEGIFRPVCHAEMTHSFLATEADLDSCPY